MTTTELMAPMAHTNRFNLYAPGATFTASELSAMSYHGVLRPQFGPYYVASDMPDTASQRAKSILLAAEPIIDGSWTATLLTAAWIYLGGQAPEMLEAATAQSHRGTARTNVISTALRHSDYLMRDEIGEDDLRMVGGVMVTSPEVTVEELLRIGGTTRHQRHAQRLATLVDEEALRRRFSYDLPGMAAARKLFEALPIAASRRG